MEKDPDLDLEIAYRECAHAGAKIIAAPASAWMHSEQEKPGRYRVGQTVCGLDTGIDGYVVPQLVENRLRPRERGDAPSEGIGAFGG